MSWWKQRGNGRWVRQWSTGAVTAAVRRTQPGSPKSMPMRFMPRYGRALLRCPEPPCIHGLNMRGDIVPARFHTRTAINAHQRDQRNGTGEPRFVETEGYQFGIVQMQRVEARQHRNCESVARQCVERLGVFHPVRHREAPPFVAPRPREGAP